MFAEQIENGLDLISIGKHIAAIYDTTLEPNQSIQPHYHENFEEIYYVLSGYGVMSIGGESKEISRGDVVYIPSLAVHTLLNTATVPLRFVTLTVSLRPNVKEDAQPYIG